jgi:hypothetical protein
MDDDDNDELTVVENLPRAGFLVEFQLFLLYALVSCLYLVWIIVPCLIYLLVTNPGPVTYVIGGKTTFFIFFCDALWKFWELRKSFMK